MLGGQRATLITMGSTFGALAIAALIGGFVVIGDDLGVGLWLVIFGSALFITSAICFVMLVVVDRMPRRTLTADQRSGLLTYLRVSRYSRGGIQVALGATLIGLGIFVVVSTTPAGFWLVGFGAVMGAVGGLNIWLAHRLGRDARAASGNDPPLPPSS